MKYRCRSTPTRAPGIAPRRSRSRRAEAYYAFGREVEERGVPGRRGPSAHRCRLTVRACARVSGSSPTGRSQRRRSSSEAFISSSARISTRRWSSPPRSPAPRAARSRFGRSWTTRRPARRSAPRPRAGPGRKWRTSSTACSVRNRDGRLRPSFASSGISTSLRRLSRMPSSWRSTAGRRRVFRGTPAPGSRAPHATGRSTSSAANGALPRSERSWRSSKRLHAQVRTIRRTT